jgi:hypothetical protein
MAIENINAIEIDFQKFIFKKIIVIARNKKESTKNPNEENNSKYNTNKIITIDKDLKLFITNKLLFLLKPLLKFNRLWIINTRENITIENINSFG